MNTFNAIAKFYKSFWTQDFCAQVIFCPIVAIHLQEDFNQIWLLAFFYKKK
jgi:hypothetical protein